jgi:hypothetical protein
MVPSNLKQLFDRSRRPETDGLLEI